MQDILRNIIDNNISSPIKDTGLASARHVLYSVSLFNLTCQDVDIKLIKNFVIKARV